MNTLRFAAAAIVFATLTSVAAANDNDSSRAYPMRPEISTYMQVRARLAATRAVQIKRFAAYSDKGVFPRNNVTTGLMNIFKDDDGNLCAAANLIALSGNRALVDRTARANNFIRLVQVKKGPLLDWMLTSGLTVEEIDRIQEPYMGDLQPEPNPTVIAAERQRLQTHFALVLAELDRNAGASLDVATRRLMAHPRLVARLLEN